MMKKNDKSGEEQELNREHGSKGSKKNLQPLENATSVVWKFLAFWWAKMGRYGNQISESRQRYTVTSVMHL